MQPGPHLKRRMCGTTGGLRKRQHGTGKENGGIRRPSTFGIPDSRGGGSQSLGHQVVGNKVVGGIRPLLYYEVAVESIIPVQVVDFQIISRCRGLSS